MPKPNLYDRQIGIIDVKAFRDNRVTLVGCGAIGSFVGISLAKMGLTNFTLYDGDTVEEHNLPNQFFQTADLGENKATALARHMGKFNKDTYIMILPGMWKDSILKDQIVISCVDKMDVRKKLFEASVKSGIVQMFIDCRMGGLQGQIYTVDIENKEDVENFRKTLFTDKQAVRLRCTERSIIFTVLGIASLVCNQIVKAFKGEEVLNFITLDYSVPQMM